MPAMVPAGARVASVGAALGARPPARPRRRPFRYIRSAILNMSQPRRANPNSQNSDTAITALPPFPVSQDAYDFTERKASNKLSKLDRMSMGRNRAANQSGPAARRPSAFLPRPQQTAARPRIYVNWRRFIAVPMLGKRRNAYDLHANADRSACSAPGPPGVERFFAAADRRESFLPSGCSPRATIISTPSGGGRCEARAFVLVRFSYRIRAVVRDRRSTQVQSVPIRAASASERWTRAYRMSQTCRASQKRPEPLPGLWI